jgi:hypothetical protein
MTVPVRHRRVRNSCRVLPLALCLGASAIGLPVAARQSSATPRSESTVAAPKHLSRKTGKQVFENIWKEIHDHYYDPAFNGVNWDEIHTK